MKGKETKKETKKEKTEGKQKAKSDYQLEKGSKSSTVSIPTKPLK